MGGFEKLKTLYEDAGINHAHTKDFGKELFCELNAEDKHEVFMVVMLKTLFEINGNLDSIAVAIRRIAKMPTQ